MGCTEESGQKADELLSLEQEPSIDSIVFPQPESVEKKVELEAFDSLEISDPVNTIQRVFNRYNEYNESTDSQANLDSLRAALKSLQDKDVDVNTLTLVIDVWMYYSVTDFATREYTEKVLFSHRSESIQALNDRIENKKDWENEEYAPFSDLEYLRSKLITDK